MDSLKGYWEESFDGLLDAGRFVISPFQFVGEDDEIDENHPLHPLVGNWPSPEAAQKKADQLGLKLLVIEE